MGNERASRPRSALRRGAVALAAAGGLLVLTATPGIAGVLDPSPLPLPVVASPPAPPAPTVPSVPSQPVPSLPALSLPSVIPPGVPVLPSVTTVRKAVSGKPVATAGAHLSANDELSQLIASHDDPTITYDGSTVHVVKCSASCTRMSVPAEVTDGTTSYDFTVDATRG